MRTRFPPLKSLLAFEAASRHGNFSQGAEELGVTPSAVSHQIQQLEDFLGVSLFQRQGGRAALTNAGKIYAREIEQAFGIIGNATTLVAPQSQSGHLVIASGPSFAAKWLQPRLSSFLDAHPGVKVRLSTLSDHGGIDPARFDIGISYGRPPSTYGDAEPLVVEKIRPYCSPELKQRVHLNQISDLSKVTFIHSANALTWSDYLRKVGHDGLRPLSELWLDRSAMAIDAAVSGTGVVLESEILVAQELLDGRLIAPFDDPALQVKTTSYFLIRPKGNRPGSAATAFENWLRESIAAAGYSAA